MACATLRSTVLGVEFSLGRLGLPSRLMARPSQAFKTQAALSVRTKILLGALGKLLLRERVALKRAEELRQLGRQLRVVHQGKSLGTVTVSVGVAEYPRHGSTGDSVLKAADVALYEAKPRGRDQARSPDGRHGGFTGTLIELPVEGGPSSGVV
ncbi:MAG: GGDEF domain-containing protein [Myxococcaceae bacterium]